MEQGLHPFSDNTPAVSKDTVSKIGMHSHCQPGIDCHFEMLSVSKPNEMNLKLRQTMIIHVDIQTHLPLSTCIWGGGDVSAVVRGNTGAAITKLKSPNRSELSKCYPPLRPPPPPPDKLVGQGNMLTSHFPELTFHS